ncbi:MAG: class I SAM-dependent methyltransferase [Candidatus Aminicenantes bacterium]|nr:class I SAM-dependent methyltransferase [Candidatus Aminicenantes bacterium]
MLKKAYNALCRLLPYHIAKTYLLPLRYRRRSVHAYRAKEFFESYYSLTDSNSDGHTVSPDAQPLLVRYHYNQVENAIIEFMAVRAGALPLSHVLDIGAGTGHWTDFYLNTFHAEQVTAIEISTVAACRLQERFHSSPVTVINQDVASAGPLPDAVDLVSAIGVMFHIVDDAELERAVEHLAARLRPGGIFIISGYFGWINQNTQFHRSDNFSSWTETRNVSDRSPLLVDKRVRSVFFWRRLLGRHHLHIEQVRRHRNPMHGPENNILFAVRRG